MELEQTFASKFAPLTRNGKIDVCPPVLRMHNGKWVLAYLVLDEPEEIDNHIPVRRPIGIILRNRKKGKVYCTYCFDEYEFVSGHDSFNKEYYNLETDPEYWPNRIPENEEKFRLLLEQLFKIVSSMTLFGKPNQQSYDRYNQLLHTLFPLNYLDFFKALENDPIVRVQGECSHRRILAAKEDKKVEQARQNILTEANEKSRLSFVKNMKQEMADFIKVDISPAIKSKGQYAKIDFFTYLGKMIRDLENNTKQYFSCYNTALTPKALKVNQETAFESQKVLIVKTYAKACVKPLVNDNTVSEISKCLFAFLDAQLQEEESGCITPETKQAITDALNNIATLSAKLVDPTAIVEMREIKERLENDYFNAPSYADMSDLYIGYKLYYDNEVKQ